MKRFFKIPNTPLGTLYFYQETPFITNINSKDYMINSLRDSKVHTKYNEYYKSEKYFYEAFTNLPAGLSFENDAFEWSNNKNNNVIVLTFMETTWSIYVGTTFPANRNLPYFDNLIELDVNTFNEEIKDIIKYRDVYINNIMTLWTKYNLEYLQEDIGYRAERERQQYIHEERKK